MSSRDDKGRGSGFMERKMVKRARGNVNIAVEAEKETMRDVPVLYPSA